MEVLSETPARLQSFVKNLGPAGMQGSYAPGKWSMNAVVCHLADCELTFGYRWRQVVAQAHHVIQPFDQDDWATNYSELDGATALAAFCSNRAWSLNWLKSLKPATLEKQVTHPERGEMTLYVLLQLTAGHDLNHLGQFEQAVAAKAGH
jgi:uncharacterized damage-inducible protein DinB